MKSIKMLMIYIICPAGNATGGTELLHQLGYKLRRLGADVNIVYIPGGSINEPHPTFKEYLIPRANMPEDNEENLIIFPEIFAQYVKSYNNAKCVLWWLSVDNYFFSLDKKRGKFNRWLMQCLQSQRYLFFGTYLKKYKLHLYQSTYAKEMLNSKGIKNVYPLKDYLHASFLRDNYDLFKKKPIVVYNPKKGAKLTKMIIKENPLISFVPIENMDRNQVIELLKSAMVYLDFGHHPGMDRIPREAAMLGCCIIVNRMGSSAFEGDIPIPSKYKINTKKQFLKETKDLISSIFAHYEKCHEELKDYREFIERQEVNFDSDLKDFYHIVNNQFKHEDKV